MLRFPQRVLSLSVCLTFGSYSRIEKRIHCDAHQNAAISTIVKTVTDNQIVMFSKTRCGYCVLAKKVLDSLNLKYVVVELDVVSDGAMIGREISRLTGMNTIPIIFVNGKLVGGYDSLQACIDNGSFQEELKKKG